MTVVEQLHRQRRAVETGWVPHIPRHHGEACLMARYDHDGYRFDSDVVLAIVAVMGDEGAHPADWNDAEGRTKDEVLAVLDLAIAKAEARC